MKKKKLKAKLTRTKNKLAKVESKVSELESELELMKTRKPAAKPAPRTGAKPAKKRITPKKKVVEAVSVQVDGDNKAAAAAQ